LQLPLAHPFSEFGFRYAERDFGKFDDIKRAEGGIRVYEAFESLLSLG